MLAEPDDVADECNARLFIGDNFGDGTATMRCQRAIGHEDLHQERFERGGGPVVVTWTGDERRPCSHGCGQWEHVPHDAHLAVGCALYLDDHAWDTCAICKRALEAV